MVLSLVFVSQESNFLYSMILTWTEKKKKKKKKGGEAFNIESFLAAVGNLLICPFTREREGGGGEREREREREREGGGRKEKERERGGGRERG